MSFTLITGASMGIGEAIAREFAGRGHNLVLVARSADKLRVLAREFRQDWGIKVEICVEDLSDAESPARVYEFCHRQGVMVDILVNCAGLSYAGDFNDLPLGKLQEIMMVNMMAMVRLTRLFLPDMVESKKGIIINVASLGGMQGVPGLALYSATKSFVLTLTEALYVELKGKGIKVFAVCPGFVDTGFLGRAGHNAANIRLPISGIDVVVNAVLKGLKKNHIWVFPTVIDKVLAFSQRAVSRKTTIRLAGFFAAVKDDCLK